MRRTFQATRRHAQRGAVAVEAAAVFALLALFFTLPSIFWAFYFYHYSAAQKAVHDAALYLATAPRLEMAAAGSDGNPAAITLAKAIIAREMAGMSLPDPGIVCSYRQASGSVVPKPCTTVNNQAYNQTLVQLSVSLDISYIDPLTGGGSGLWISPYTVVSYIGN
jgi:Flp pilus assembly protein TadG